MSLAPFRCLIAATLVLVAAPATAQATDYCVQDGAAPAVVCPGSYAGVTFQTIAGVLPNLVSNDTVRIEPGTYDEQVTFGGRQNVVFFGDPAQPRPLIRASNPGASVVLINQNGGGTVLRHLQIEQTSAVADSHAVRTSGGVASPAVTLDDVGITSAASCGQFDGPLTATDLSASSPGYCLVMQAAGNDLRRITVTSSTGTAIFAARSLAIDGATVTAPAGSGIAGQSSTHVAHARVTAQQGVVAEGTFTLTNSLITSEADPSVGVTVVWQSQGAIRNVTVSAPGPQSVGVKVFPGFGPFPTGGSVTVTNAIVRGGAGDLQAPPAGFTCNPVACLRGRIDADHTNYRPASDDGVTVGAGNQSGDPLFASAADFHLSAASPAINAGATTPAGDTDLDGAARQFAGTASDLGAYESTTAPATPPPAPPASPAPVPAPAPAPSAKQRPRVTIKVKRDKAASIGYRVTGKLIFPAGVSAANGCKGTVNITVRRSKTLLAQKTARVNKACAYSATVKIKRSKLKQGNRLSFVTRYATNAQFANNDSPAVRVTFVK